MIYFKITGAIYKLKEETLPIKVTGIPSDNADIAVHLPVPFCPAASLIFSTRGSPLSSLNCNMAAVISIKYESNSVLFQSSNTC